VIELRGLSRTFRLGDEEVHALADVDETIASGEHLAIMGPSGSGKSTLLNLIGCLDRPSAGSYRFDGEEVETMDEARLDELRQRRIGFVFQSFHMIPRLDARENVELPMIFAGVPRAERHTAADRALAEVGMSHRARPRPSELSGGERQRLAIARAIAMKPSLLLADEPTGNLDSRSGDVVLDLLDRLNDEGLTVVVVTHDPRVAQRADRVLILSDGRVVRRAPRAEMLEALSEWGLGQLSS